MNRWNLWKFGFRDLQLSSLKKVLRGCLFKALTLRAPGTLTHHPLFVIGSLY